MPFRLSFAAPRRRRRSPSFDGDFRLEDLFQQHIESEEEDVDDDDEMVDIEPLLYDEKKEAAWVAEKAEALKRAAEEKAREAEEKKRAAEEKAREAERRERSRKKHDAVIKSIRRYDPKAKCLVWTRFPFEDFSSFDLDEESAVPSMRHTNKTYQTECARYCSANILSVKVISSDVGFPIHVYGTVIARDSLDKKCVYLFQCHRRNSQLIMSEDESLILTGPARGLLLIDFIFLETDLKIKGERGQDKQLSKGLLQIDGRRLTWENIEAVTCASRLSTVEVKYAVVKDAVEATLKFRSPMEIFMAKSQLTPPASFIELSYMIAKLLGRQPLVLSNFGAVP